MPTATNSPRFELPQSPEPRGRGGVSGLVFVLLLVLLVVNVLSLFVARGNNPLRAPLAESGLPAADKLKEVAIDLESKNLPSQAADTWESYLDLAPLSTFETGNIRYRIGKRRQEAGQYAEAFKQYALAEKLLADSTPDLAREIGLRRVECLRRLGQYADLAREVTQRATDSKEDLQGQQVVAEVDNQKITVVDFDRMLTSKVDMAVQSRMGLSPEEEDALRRRAHDQLADPKVRTQELQQMIATRLLADEARKHGLHRDEAFLNRLTEMADQVLAGTLLHEEVQKRGTVTDADVERYYKANSDRYADPAGTFIAHILCRDEDSAKGILERINNGESFGQLAKSESLDTETKANMGVIATPVPADGEFVPIFGNNAELHEKIRDAAAGDVLDQPYQSSRGWHLIKVMSHREKTEKPFDDVKDDVRRDTIAARQREVTDQFIQDLFKQHGVKLYPEAFSQKADTTGATEAEKMQDQEPS